MNLFRYKIRNWQEVLANRNHYQSFINIFIHFRIFSILKLFLMFHFLPKNLFWRNEYQQMSFQKYFSSSFIFYSKKVCSSLYIIYRCVSNIVCMFFKPPEFFMFMKQVKYTVYRTVLQVFYLNNQDILNIKCIEKIITLYK